MLPDPRQLDPEVRLQLAERARNSHDALAFTSQMTEFNSAPCSRHRVQPNPEAESTAAAAAPVPGCPDCGMVLRRHQRIGATWLWFRMSGLLGDSCGLGKTAQVGAVLAMALQTSELSLDNRAVIVCQAAAVRQWARELRRMVPNLLVIAADGDPEQRMRAYLGAWTVAVISDRTLAPAGKPGKRGYRPGDIERLRQFPVGILVYDDIDAMRNGTTKTAWAVRKMAQTADRVYDLHATSLQKRLTELYNHLVPLGAARVFGTEAEFREEYITKGETKVWVPVSRAFPAEKNEWARRRGYASFALLEMRAREDRANGQTESEPCKLMGGVQTGKTRLERVIYKDAGVKENRLPEFKRLVHPMVLRRTVDDLDDVDLPAVQATEVWLELLPQQRERYKDLQKGILKRLKDAETEITKVESAAAYTRARQICSGLATLDSGEEAHPASGTNTTRGLLSGDVSAKLDWTMDRLTGDLSDEKVFCFVYFKPNVEALSRRLTAAGIGHVILWSNETDPKVRDSRIQQFTRDPDCRVVIATTTAERSLNLQAAGHLIAVDCIPNPARMTQVLGRVRRIGSRHRMVVFHQLLIRDTHEEDMMAMMRREQALADAVWDDTGELYTEAMTPREIMASIARRAA